MACGITDLTGCVGDVVGSAVTSVWDNICQSFGDAATSMLQSFGNAFASTDTVDLGSDGVRSVYALSLGIAGTVAALLLLWQVLRTVWTHDGNAIAQGLVGVGKAALAFLLTLGVTTAGVEAADDVTKFIVQRGFGTDAALGQKLGALFAANLGSAPTLLMIMALLGIIITVVLWFELLMRGAAIAILVATSPIAAAGQVNDSTKSWWSKLVSATIQLIILKPIIALVFMLGFKVSSQSSGIQGTLTGLLILLLAVFAWPSVARFFAFASVAVGGAAGLGGLLGFASGRAAAAGGASHGGGSSTGFSQVAEARTAAAKSALGIGPAIGGFGSAGIGGAGADAVKQTAMKGAMAKASTALAAAGPVGLAVAGAKAAQGAVNAVSGRMEQMAGHAGLSNANPHHQAAGANSQQGRRQAQVSGSGTRPASQTIAERPEPGSQSASSSAAGVSVRAERMAQPEELSSSAAYEAERIPDRGEPVLGMDEGLRSVQSEAQAETEPAGSETPGPTAESHSGSSAWHETPTPVIGSPQWRAPTPPPSEPSGSPQQQVPPSPSSAPEPMRKDVQQKNEEKDQ